MELFFGTLPQRTPFPKNLHLILTVTYMTSSLTAVPSIIPWIFTHSLMWIGPPAPKHDILLQAAASALQVVLLPIRLNSNPQLPNPPQRLNSWELVMPEKCYSMCVASCGTSGSLKQLPQCSTKTLMHALPWLMLKNLPHKLVTWISIIMRFVNGSTETSFAPNALT
jgi:hypothetical protein